MSTLLKAVCIQTLAWLVQLAMPALAADQVLYDALWEKTLEDRPAVWGWTRADFDKKAADLARQGYSLRDLSSFINPDGAQRFNAIWHKGKGDIQAVWGWSRGDFDRKAAELARQGFQLRTLSALLHAGAESFNGIWEKTREDRHAVWAWARVDFDHKAADMASKGYRLVLVNAYVRHDGQPLFNAVWTKSPADRPAVWDWTRADFDKRAADLSAAGYRFVDLNSHASMSHGKTLYNAIWAKGQDEQGVVWGWARADFDKKHAELAERGFRLSRISAHAPARPCEISGRLIGGEDYWSLTSVGVRGPGDYAQRPADPVRVGAEGAYAFRGLARGRYKVYTDMRADLGTGFKPAQHIVDCLTDKQSGIDFTWPTATPASTGGTKPGPGLGKQ